MRMKFAALLFVIALGPGYAQQQKAQPSKAENASAQPGKDAENPSATSVEQSSNIALTSPPDANAGTKQKPESPTDPIKSTDWIMVGLTAVYVVISGIGLTVISKQTTIAAEAAKAALLNAEAVIKAERPWLLPFIEGDKFVGFTFKVRNVGKSPAKIVWLNPIIHLALLPVGEYPAYPSKLRLWI